MILALLALGFLAAHAPDRAREAALLRLHVPLGLLVVAMTIARIALWFFDTRPGDIAKQPGWQALTAHVTHILLYGLLILLAVSGIGLMVLSRAAPVLFFKAPGALPRFADFPPMVVHGLGAFAIVALHRGAAVPPHRRGTISSVLQTRWSVRAHAHRVGRRMSTMTRFELRHYLATETARSNPLVERLHHVMVEERLLYPAMSSLRGWWTNSSVSWPVDGDARQPFSAARRC